VDAPRLGAKIRQLRRQHDITQAALAERLAISPSYLNLIENDRRPLPATVLLRLAELFRLDLASFRGDEENRLERDLGEALGDPALDGAAIEPAQLRRFVVQQPEVARAMLALYRAYRTTRDSAESLAATLEEPGDLAPGVDSVRLSSELVSDFIEKKHNHFPSLEEAASRVRKDAGLDGDDLFAGLARFLKKEHRVDVTIEKVGAMHGALRRYMVDRRELLLSEVLRRGSRNFQLAHQVALLHFAPLLETIAKDSVLTTNESRALARVSLANYFASALLMPYEAFLAAARDVRYDIELLEHRFRASFEQVCHRLTTLRRRGHEGVPFDLVRVDIAGNLSKRFAASGIRFPRFSGLCPLWNVHAAFLRPGFIRTQLAELEDGSTYFSLARTIEKHRGGYRAPRVLYAIALATDVESARELVYADGVDLANRAAAVPVGVTCRMCTRLECEARAFPPLRGPLRIDENVLGRNFYSPLDGPRSK
jgi:predicted transcriptional regulator/transcriptional regulator with XRE-family HTH domain